MTGDGTGVTGSGDVIGTTASASHAPATTTGNR